MLEHPDHVQIASRLSAEQLESRRAVVPNLAIVDVRGPGEIDEGMVGGAVHLQLASLLQRASELDPAVPTVVYCAGGYRSSIAASTLRSLGFNDVSDIVGGYGAWKVNQSA
jgi:hydroxyacylglutathione hydrolase